MSNVIKLPGRNSRARKSFRLKRAKQRYSEFISKMEAEMRALSDFSDIRTQSDLDALEVNDPFRFMKYASTVAQF